MKKPIKYWLITMAVLLLLGLVLVFTGGILLGGDIWQARSILHWGPINLWGGPYDWRTEAQYDKNWDEKRTMNLEHMDFSAITGIELDMSGVNEIHLALGEEFKVELESCVHTPKSRVERGIWKLEQREPHKNSRIWITLPKNLTLTTAQFDLAGGELFVDGVQADQMEIDMAAGSIDVQNMQCRELDVDMTAGTLNCSGNVLGEVDASLTAGEMNLKLPRPERYEYEVSGAAGNITIDGQMLSGFGDQKGGAGGGIRFDIECIAGEVNVNFE